MVVNYSLEEQNKRMDKTNGYIPRHANQESNVEYEVIHLDLCNPNVIFTLQERAELDRDLGKIVLNQRRAAAQAPYIYLD